MIAGYSYGGMLAFEIAKSLESRGDEVRFVGSINRPPYVHPRLCQVTWTECLVHLAYFIDIISELEFRRFFSELRGLTKKKVVARIVSAANSARWAELGLSREKLASWADVNFSLQVISRDYQSTGSVRHMDVFLCNPLSFVGAIKEERLKRLAKWEDLSRDEIKYYEIHSEHHRVFGPENIHEVHQALQTALTARGA